MTDTLSKLLENNRRWAAKKTSRDKRYFARQAATQLPKYLFIGASDLGVSPSELLGVPTGELLVHHNVANLVVHADMSLLSTLQYAVQECGIEDVMVCGHYDCGGVAAVASAKQHGLLDSWLTHVRDVVRLHERELLRIGDDERRRRRLVELNVMEQVRNLAKTNIIQSAVQNGHSLRLHGLVYDAATGLILDLNTESVGLGAWTSIYETLSGAALTYARGTWPLAPVARLAAEVGATYRRRSA